VVRETPNGGILRLLRTTSRSGPATEVGHGSGRPRENIRLPAARSPRRGARHAAALAQAMVRGRKMARRATRLGEAVMVAPAGPHCHEEATRPDPQRRTPTPIETTERLRPRSDPGSAGAGSQDDHRGGREGSRQRPRKATAQATPGGTRDRTGKNVGHSRSGRSAGPAPSWPPEAGLKLAGGKSTRRCRHDEKRPGLVGRRS
jgi:hypothetical protein